MHFKKENFFSPSVFLLPLFKVYKKIVNFSFTQQKIFWVLVFSIHIWYLAYPTDRSLKYTVACFLADPTTNTAILTIKLLLTI